MSNMGLISSSACDLRTAFAKPASAQGVRDYRHMGPLIERAGAATSARWLAQENAA
jgi:hypothetical protein